MTMRLQTITQTVLNSFCRKLQWLKRKSDLITRWTNLFSISHQSSAFTTQLAELASPESCWSVGLQFLHSRWLSLTQYSRIRMFQWDADEKLEDPSWLCCLLAFVTSVNLEDWLAKLNSLSEWSLSPTGFAAESTSSLSWEATVKGLTSARGAGHTTKSRAKDAHQWPNTGWLRAWSPSRLEHGLTQRKSHWLIHLPSQPFPPNSDFFTHNTTGHLCVQHNQGS